MIRNWLFVILVLIPALTIRGQTLASSTTNIEGRIHRVESGLLFNSSITDRMDTHNVPGVSIAVINNYEIEWTKGYGVLELGGDQPVTEDTLFQAASIAKPVTAVGALHHVEKGLIDLDENVNDRLVSWRVPENEYTAQGDVTLRRLLSHTAGLNDSLYRGYTPGEDLPTIPQVLEGEPPAHSLPVRVVSVPGVEERYSNGGYLVVAQLLEDVLEKPFPEIIQETVFTPLDMTSSTFDQLLPDELRARAATAHGWDVGAWKASPGLVAPSRWHTHNVGMGGLWTTAPDLARFAIEVMRAYSGESDMVLSQETAKLMLTPVAEGIPLQEPFDADQALGFSQIHLDGEAWLVHFGGSFPGYVSGLIAQPERGLGIVVMTNAWSGYELIWEIYYSFFYAYGIMPGSAQVLNMAYSGLLFLIVCVIWPASWAIRRLQFRKQFYGVHLYQLGRGVSIALAAVILTLMAVLLLTFLYRGPLGGFMVPDRAIGATPLSKGLLGLFFFSPVILMVCTVLVWNNRYWSKRERVHYTLIVLGVLLGVVLLRDLWGLMFWN